MSKYTIKRACGHTEYINIGGKVSERDRLAKSEERKMCYDCYKAKQIADRELATKDAVVAAVKSGLPALTGSEKQIAWAETIRSNIIRNLDRIVAQASENKASLAVDLEDALKVAIATIKAVDSAKWWIDHRDSYLVDSHLDLRTLITRLIFGTSNPTNDHPLFGAKSEIMLEALRNFKA